MYTLTTREDDAESEETVYRLIASPDPDKTVPEEYRTVYSVLALIPDDGFRRARFVYDVSRKKEVAEAILGSIVSAKPDESELSEFVSGLL